MYCTSKENRKNKGEKHRKFLSMKLQKTPISLSNLEKENGAGGIRLPGFRLYHKPTVIKTVWHWPKKKKNRNVDQQNRIEGTENDRGEDGCMASPT